MDAWLRRRQQPSALSINDPGPEMQVAWEESK